MPLLAVRRHLVVHDDLLRAIHLHRSPGDQHVDQVGSRVSGQRRTTRPQRLQGITLACSGTVGPSRIPTTTGSPSTSLSSNWLALPLPTGMAYRVKEIFYSL